MKTITLNKRKIPLYFSCYEMKLIQEEIASPFNRAINLVLGVNPEDREDDSNYGTVEHLYAVTKMVRILGNAGLEESGSDAYLTDRWIMRAMKPGALVSAINTCIDTINDVMGEATPEDAQADSEAVQGDGKNNEKQK